MSRKCFLHCTQTLRSPVELLNLQKINLGRSKEMNIVDSNCSKEQIRFTADCSECFVWVESIGRNTSGINGYGLKKNNPIKAIHGDHIEFLLNKHIHIIKFDPPPNVKKKSSSPIDECEPAKKLKDDVSENCTANEKFETIDNGALYIYTSTGVKPSTKVAAYDIDGTIIKTKSGLVFPKNIDDWQFAFPEVPGKIKKLHSDGFKIVFFTNQAQIGSGKLKPHDFETKLRNIIKKLNIPVQVFISSGKGCFRKPLMGMWNTFIETKNDNIEVDKNESFYCGDAAGRKGDHSLADRLFASNIKLQFYTPETHFCGRPESAYSKPSFDPKEFLKLDNPEQNLTSNTKEIVLMVGYPGSGKSFISKQMEVRSKYRYKAVCRDTLGTYDKCVSETEKALKNGKSVIIDCTNPDVESRARWINFAKKHNLPCRCFKMDVSFEHSKHNNKFRQLTDTSHSFVGDIVFNTYKKKFSEPKLEEGFQEIVLVKFVPIFNDPKSKKLYGKYMLEK